MTRRRLFRNPFSSGGGYASSAGSRGRGEGVGRRDALLCQRGAEVCARGTARGKED